MSLFSMIYEVVLLLQSKTSKSQCSSARALVRGLAYRWFELGIRWSCDSSCSDESWVDEPIFQYILRHLSGVPPLVKRCRSPKTGSSGLWMCALFAVSACVLPVAMTCLFWNATYFLPSSRST